MLANNAARSCTAGEQPAVSAKPKAASAGTRHWRQRLQQPRVRSPVMSPNRVAKARGCPASSRLRAWPQTGQWGAWRRLWLVPRVQSFDEAIRERRVGPGVPDAPGFDRWQAPAGEWILPKRTPFAPPAPPAARAPLRWLGIRCEVHKRSWSCPQLTPPCKKLRCAPIKGRNSTLSLKAGGA